MKAEQFKCLNCGHTDQYSLRKAKYMDGSYCTKCGGPIVSVGIKEVNKDEETS